MNFVSSGFLDLGVVSGKEKSRPYLMDIKGVPLPHLCASCRQQCVLTCLAVRREVLHSLL